MRKRCPQCITNDLHVRRCDIAEVADAENCAGLSPSSARKNDAEVIPPKIGRMNRFSSTSLTRGVIALLCIIFGSSVSLWFVTSFSPETAGERTEGIAEDDVPCVAHPREVGWGEGTPRVLSLGVALRNRHRGGFTDG